MKTETTTDWDDPATMAVTTYAREGNVIPKQNIRGQWYDSVSGKLLPKSEWPALSCSAEEGKRIQEYLKKLDEPVTIPNPLNINLETPTIKLRPRWIYRMEMGIVYTILALGMLIVLPVSGVVYGHFFVDVVEWLSPLVGPVIKGWFR